MTNRINAFIRSKPTAAMYILVGIPIFFMLIIIVLLTYLGMILRDVEDQGTNSSCRAKVSQEIQEHFRIQSARLVAAAYRDDKTLVASLLHDIQNEVPYQDKVKLVCGKDT